MPIYDVTIRELLKAFSDVNKDLEVIKGVANDLDIEFSKLTPLREAVFKEVSASDSSTIYRSYEYMSLYVIQGVSIKYPSSSTRTPPIVKTGAIHVKNIHLSSGREPEHVVERKARMSSKLLELKLTEESLESSESCLALFDGSLISFLSFGVKEERPELRSLWVEIRDRVRKLSKKATAVFVAKTIRLSHYINKWFRGVEEARRFNDIAVLEYARRIGKLPLEPHYVEPLVISDSSELPDPLGKPGFELDGIIPMAVTYVSLGYGAPYYQVTIPGVRGLEDVDIAVRSLMKYSRSGYPDPLRIAHHLCKLKASEVNALLLKVGFSILKTGREPLGEFT